MSQHVAAPLTSRRRAAIAIALGSIGAALRLWQYLGRGTLWLDEAAIARNIVGRTYGGLLQPLDYAQIAPKGFLLFEKFAVDAFGTSEYALRLYAILTALAALPLFYALARRVLSEHGALLAFAFFALLGRPIYYASEAKQYGGDIFFACLLLLLAFRIGTHGRTRHWLRLGILGALAVWFSQPALFVLAGIGIALAVGVAQKRIALRWPAVVACVFWAASGIPSLYLTLQSLAPSERAYMRSFWADGFWPVPPASLHELAWPIVNLYGLFRDPLAMPVTALGVGLFAVGCVALFRQRPLQCAALVGSLVALYVASALGMYPFDTTISGFNKMAAGNGRVLLFLVPGLIIVLVAGAMALISFPLRRVRGVGLAAATLLIAAPLYYDVAGIPYSPHDLSAAMDVMRQQARPGDHLYVYYGARQAFEWYRPRFAFADDHVLRGGCYRPAWREYLRELDRFRGAGRLWVLVVRPGEVNGVPEGALLESYLDHVSPRLGRWGPKDAFVLLHDFSAVPPLSGPASAWHPPPRRLAADTVALGVSCAGIFPGPGAPPPAQPARLTRRSRP